MKPNYQYIVFSPYFGKLPATFNLWAQSCGYNSEFLFIVFTDDTYKGPLPENVQLKHMSFQELQLLVQSKFNFKIALSSPYKLCDYRPAFGYIFQEYLSNCSYWGYCDMDLIFGNISKFLPQKVYDKISHMGHLCLYRNVPEITKAFMLPSTHAINYQDIFSSNTHFAFDENYDFGINAIFRAQHFTIYPFQIHVADISSWRNNFVLSHYQAPGFTAEFGERIFSVEDGTVRAHTLTKNGIEQKEYAYVHIQKRSLKCLFKGTPQRYLITPTSFEAWKPVTPAFIKSCQQKTSRWACWLKKYSIKRVSLPRALRRRLTIQKIVYLKKLGKKKEL